MKFPYTIAIAVFTGFGLGGIAVQALHAQGKPPAYYVAEVEAADENVYMNEWAPKISETIKAAGGVYLARGTNIRAIEGTPPKRVVISKWESMDKLNAWRNGEAYKGLDPVRAKAIKSTRTYAIEGLAN